MAQIPWHDNRNWRRWARIALVLSAFLHLLFFLCLDLVYTPLAPPERGYRVLLKPPTTFASSQPTPSLAPSRLPIPTFSPDGATGPGQTPLLGMGGQPEGEGAGPGITGVAGLPAGEAGAGRNTGEKASAFAVPALPDLDYDRFLIEKLRQEVTEREQYARFHLLDADTTDEDSQRRSRARQIVERAIAAMGGREALGRIREMKVRVWVEATEHCVILPHLPPRVVNEDPYAFPVALWQYQHGTFTTRPIAPVPSFDPKAPNIIALTRDPCVTLPKYYTLFESRWAGARPPVPGPTGGQREQGEGARWHFIDHFLGEGVQLHYLEEEEYRNPYPRHEQDLEDRGWGRRVEVVRVEDERYGQYQEALFDVETGLLLAIREGLTPEEERWHTMQYARPAPVWLTTYGNYQPVRGVLTPHRLVRGSTQPAIFVAIHLKIAYNGDEPDQPEPDVNQ